MSADLPSIDLPRADLEAGFGLLGAIVTAGLAASNGEARRHVQGGAVKINDAAIADVRHELGLSDVLDEGVIKLSVGRKKHVLLRIV